MKNGRRIAIVSALALVVVSAVWVLPRRQSGPGVAPVEVRVETARLDDRDTHLPIELLEALQHVRPAGARNLFEYVEVPPRSSHIVATLPPAATSHGRVQPPQQQQAEAEIAPLQFYGYVSRGTHSLRGFFSDGSEIYIKAEGEVIANRYRVIRIDGSSALIEDTSMKARLRLMLAEG